MHLSLQCGVNLVVSSIYVVGSIEGTKCTSVLSDTPERFFWSRMSPVLEILVLRQPETQACHTSASTICTGSLRGNRKFNQNILLVELRTVPVPVR